MITCTILPHISFAVTQLPSVSPKQGKTDTLTFCVSDAAIAYVTGGLSLAVLHSRHYEKKGIHNHELVL